jgi:hypothetical protein
VRHSCPQFTPSLGQRLSKADILGNLPGGVELPLVNSSFCRS